MTNDATSAMFRHVIPPDLDLGRAPVALPSDRPPAALLATSATTVASDAISCGGNPPRFGRVGRVRGPSCRRGRNMLAADTSDPSPRSASGRHPTNAAEARRSRALPVDGVERRPRRTRPQDVEERHA